jgi:hypothetical protein
MTDSIEFDTICPFCDCHHNRTSAVKRVRYPEDGDATLCLRCGRFCIFHRDAPGGLRKPTKQEQDEFDRDDDMNKIIDAWKAIRP